MPGGTRQKECLSGLKTQNTKHKGDYELRIVAHPTSHVSLPAVTLLEKRCHSSPRLDEGCANRNDDGGAGEGPDGHRPPGDNHRP
jgi:hypothetical protein